MSYKLLNDLGKEVRRTNSIAFAENATPENMLLVSKAAEKVMQYAITDTVNLRRTSIVE